MTAKTHLGIYTTFIFAVFLIAYLGMLPLKLITFYWFDSVGHFILYGLWGYFFGMAFPQPVFRFGKFCMVRGIVISIAIAVVEECAQSLSPYRSFSFSDMAFGVCGILVAAVCLNYLVKRT